ncbi:MAG: diadenylate cyclase CdaA [Bacteroidales bacterium]|nr:diadenylate cyclase CdaA [Bacteroidales bacterium]
MLLLDLGFLNISLPDILDILMVATIIYFAVRWIRHSSAMNIFIAIIVLLLVRLLVNALDMKMMSALLGAVIDIGTIALVVIFQPEIRHFLSRIGRRKFTVNGSRKSIVDRILRREVEKMDADLADEVARACDEMAEQKVGALIVIPRTDSLDAVIDSGDKIDAVISKRLIENIFFKNSPLHDGAMVLASNRIIAARCTLPISTRENIPARYGMRHKAAVGISEASDADVIVVSEQTGKISWVSNGVITPVNNINTLKLLIANDGQKTGSEAGV